MPISRTLATRLPLICVSTAAVRIPVSRLVQQAHRRRDDLFYADPREVFDLCVRQFSPRVALLHDYPLFEFTVIVRK